MKRYKVKVEEVRITEFNVDAKNKQNAHAIVEDIILNTNILNLSCVGHKFEVRIALQQTKGNNLNEADR